jgi:hypothetical protein
VILHSKDITEIWDVQIRMYERMYDMYASHVEHSFLFIFFSVVLNI